MSFYKFELQNDWSRHTNASLGQVTRSGPSESITCMFHNAEAVPVTGVFCTHTYAAVNPTDDGDGNKEFTFYFTSEHLFQQVAGTNPRKLLMVWKQTPGFAAGQAIAMAAGEYGVSLELIADAGYLTVNIQCGIAPNLSETVGTHSVAIGDVTEWTNGRTLVFSVRQARSGITYDHHYEFGYVEANGADTLLYSIAEQDSTQDIDIEMLRYGAFKASARLPVGHTESGVEVLTIHTAPENLWGTYAAANPINLEVVSPEWIAIDYDPQDADFVMYGHVIHFTSDGQFAGELSPNFAAAYIPAFDLPAGPDQTFGLYWEPGRDYTLPPTITDAKSTDSYTVHYGQGVGYNDFSSNDLHFSNTLAWDDTAGRYVIRLTATVGGSETPTIIPLTGSANPTQVSYGLPTLLGQPYTPHPGDMVCFGHEFTSAGYTYEMYVRRSGTTHLVYSISRTYEQRIIEEGRDPLNPSNWGPYNEIITGDWGGKPFRIFAEAGIGKDLATTIDSGDGISVGISPYPNTVMGAYPSPFNPDLISPDLIDIVIKVGQEWKKIDENHVPLSTIMQCEDGFLNIRYPGSPTIQQINIVDLPMGGVNPDTTHVDDYISESNLDYFKWVPENQQRFYHVAGCLMFKSLEDFQLRASAVNRYSVGSDEYTQYHPDLEISYIGDEAGYLESMRNRLLYVINGRVMPIELGDDGKYYIMKGRDYLIAGQCMLNVIDTWQLDGFTKIRFTESNVTLMRENAHVFEMLVTLTAPNDNSTPILLANGYPAFMDGTYRQIASNKYIVTLDKRRMVSREVNAPRPYIDWVTIPGDGSNNGIFDLSTIDPVKFLTSELSGFIMLHHAGLAVHREPIGRTDLPTLFTHYRHPQGIIVGTDGIIRHYHVHDKHVDGSVAITTSRQLVGNHVMDAEIPSRITCYSVMNDPLNPRREDCTSIDIYKL